MPTKDLKDPSACGVSAFFCVPLAKCLFGLPDSHFRIGGALGTDLQAADCPTGSSSDACIAASLGLHVTSGASGYFENMWVWTAGMCILPLKVPSRGS